MTDPLVQLLEIELMGENPDSFSSAFRWRMRVQSSEKVSDLISISIIWVGSASSSQFDQTLDAFDVGPLEEGVTEFILECDAPQLDLVPREDVLGVTILLISFQYKSQEFLRVGYYTQVAYFDVYLNQHPPEIPQGNLLGRWVRKVKDDGKATEFTACVIKATGSLSRALTMLAERYVQDYVRDQKTWKRAASQPFLPGATSAISQVRKSRIWHTFRRGAADDASTAHFAGELRGESAASLRVICESWHTKADWNPSTTYTPPPDILMQALQKRLERRNGATLPGAVSRRPHGGRAAREEALQDVFREQEVRRKREEFQFQLAQIIQLERKGRAQIVTCERTQRMSAVNSVMTVLRATMEAEEYYLRKTHFRGAELLFDELADLESQCFSAIVGMSHEGYRALALLMKEETTRRSYLEKGMTKETVRLSNVAQLLHLSAVEDAIVRCARREASLRQQQARAQRVLRK